MLISIVTGAKWISTTRHPRTFCCSIEIAAPPSGPLGSSCRNQPASGGRFPYGTFSHQRLERNLSGCRCIGLPKSLVSRSQKNFVAGGETITVPPLELLASINSVLRNSLCNILPLVSYKRSYNSQLRKE